MKTYYSLLFLLILGGCAAPPQAELSVPETIYRGNEVSISISLSSPQATAFSGTASTAFLFTSSYSSLNPNQPMATLDYSTGLSTNISYTVDRYSTESQEEVRLEFLDHPEWTLTETRSLSHYALIPGQTNTGTISGYDVFDMYQFSLSSETNIRFTLIDPHSNLSILLYSTLGGSSLFSDESPNSPTNIITAASLGAGTYYFKVNGGILATPSEYTLLSTYLP